ncbi:IclR family transcriptional regulator [Alisedimentitalea sp. MJ-SS2]|uniref:IclR family transcriptional regulator n=1 Tax=Aliisedimentitalea sp. MJ-SS2 TaxID=3049795 RepID=UPI00290719F2|nr:IclR family transcriptional regulator [Alisedimentitalea sp. MJ-SS2]MDU8929226.1 IclR family transcriptional regulator [Alisedimentitalea sp. MJ-SS2]
MASSDRIPTNLRTLLILEVLGRSDQPMTATEINEQLGLPKQTVHRLCVTLEENGFIARLGHSKRYQIARRLRELGAGLLHNSRDHIARRQILKDLATSVGETVNFVIPETDGMRYLDRVETDWAFRIQLPIGTNVPFHCTASGKCFLASLPPKQRHNLVQNLNFERMTSHTHVSAESLMEELAGVRKLGYSLDREEFLDGMIALAVPMTDKNGRFISAIAMHGPTQRLSIDLLVSQVDLIQEAAKRLSEVLFSA